MSIFGEIWNKITGSADASPETATAGGTPGEATPTTPSATPMTAIDVERVLDGIAANKGGVGDWRNSIVDLLKLLDLDSSTTARTALAAELNVHEGAIGTTEENISLHRAVMQKLEENGGKVPESLKG